MTTEEPGRPGSAGEDEFRGLEMDPEAMRALGYRVVDLLVDRWKSLPDAPAWEGATREELEPILMEPAPEEARPVEEVLERAAKTLSVAGRIDHPRFFAFIPSSPTWPGVMGDFLTSGFNVFQGTWLESAGPSEMELVVLDWFRRWVGLPAEGGGLLTSGGSAANLMALVAAREAAEEADRGRIYLSDQGHSSLERAARIAGIPPERVVRIPTDQAFRIDVNALRERLARDREAGHVPMCVCASAGTTNTGTVDPMEEVAVVAREAGAWFHVDAAYGGFAVLVPELRDALEGMAVADSVTLDPHKWLFQPYEVGCLLVRDTARLEAAFRVLPDYLQDTKVGLEEVNFADRGIQLTRAFRALKIWLSVQTMGLGAFRQAVGRGVELARRAEAQIRESPWLELLSPASLGVVCYRVRPPDHDGDEGDLERLNARVNDEVVRTGYAMISSTRLRGRYSLRLCILNHRSRWSDVEGTLERVVATGRELSVDG